MIDSGGAVVALFDDGHTAHLHAVLADGLRVIGAVLELIKHGLGALCHALLQDDGGLAVVHARAAQISAQGDVTIASDQMQLVAAPAVGVALRVLLAAVVAAHLWHVLEIGFECASKMSLEASGIGRRWLRTLAWATTLAFGGLEWALLHDRAWLEPL